ncbi:hypothetical protein ACTXT7_015396 [Hymenolepis weldensis]
MALELNGRDWLNVLEYQSMRARVAEFFVAGFQPSELAPFNPKYLGACRIGENKIQRYSRGVSQSLVSPILNCGTGTSAEINRSQLDGKVGLLNTAAVP